MSSGSVKGFSTTGSPSTSILRRLPLPLSRALNNTTPPPGRQLGGPSGSLRDAIGVVTPLGNSTRISERDALFSKYAIGPSSDAVGKNASPGSSVNCVSTRLAKSSDQRQKCPVRFDANTIPRPSAENSGSGSSEGVRASAPPPLAGSRQS